LRRDAAVGGLQAELQAIERDVLERIRACRDPRELEDVRVRVLGKKGELTRLLRSFAELPQQERPEAGKLLNRSKEAIQAELDARGAEMERSERGRRLAGPAADVTLPAYGPPPGRLHPLTRTTAEICDVLRALGFSIEDGPDVEDEYHNFEALNIPADHPARDMQDTFFVTDGRVLRTHTSPVQIRVMQRTQPPLRIIAPGSVYRTDDDVTHSPNFHQVEGFMIDRDVTFAHLKHVLGELMRRLFGPQCRLRFRPSFFPFTEPSAEVDIGCVICGGSGMLGGSPCRVCKRSGWLEILGAGMIDPAVFEAVGYDPEAWTGFAFGLGVERIAMLKYGVDDIRLLFGGDLRFLAQV
jgi:phenylalanyl-tRNA synthetase alpha chain